MERRGLVSMIKYSPTIEDLVKVLNAIRVPLSPLRDSSAHSWSMFWIHRLLAALIPTTFSGAPAVAPVLAVSKTCAWVSEVKARR